MMRSTASRSQILLNPRRPNFELSASTTTFCAALIIAPFSDASSMLVVVSPNSVSMPSTPTNSLLQLKLRSIDSAKGPTTETELLRVMPPSWMTSTSACCERICVTGTAAVMTVRRPTGLISRARKAIVVPEAMMIESSCDTRAAAAAPIARFSATFFFSFSLTWRSLI